MKLFFCRLHISAVCFDEFTSVIAAHFFSFNKDINFSTVFCRVNIVILETSDLHGRLFSYDYAIDQVDSSAGLTKAATIIKEEGTKNKNLILADNGDTVQDNNAE